MAQQQQQQQSGDHSMAPVWITVLIFVSLFLIWRSAHQYIVSFIFSINLIQAKMVLYFIDSPILAHDIYIMETIDPVAVNWDQLVGFCHRTGEYVRYPYIGLLFFLAFILYKSDITLKYRKTYDMKKLRAQEQRNWPAIMPVVKEDLVNADINVGPWAMALTPMEFARKYRLLKKNDALLDSVNAIPGEEMTATIRRGDAKRVFTLQLGPAWEGFERCPGHVKALMAVFMARMNRDKAAANKILAELDKGYAANKLNYAIANPTLQKYHNGKDVQEIVSKHAYVLTVIAALLAAARNDGVVPSAEFLWLKTVDRRLWYMLNCVGRQTPFAEVAGPFAHWRAEKEMGRRSLAPMIDEAIKALEVAIKEVKLSPKELQELEP